MLCTSAFEEKDIFEMVSGIITNLLKINISLCEFHRKEPEKYDIFNLFIAVQKIYTEKNS